MAPLAPETAIGAGFAPSEAGESCTREGAGDGAAEKPVAPPVAGEDTAGAAAADAADAAGGEGGIDGFAAFGACASQAGTCDSASGGRGAVWSEVSSATSWVAEVSSSSSSSTSDGFDPLRRSSAAISAALGYRRLGSFSRHRVMIAVSPGGRSLMISSAGVNGS